MRYYQSDMKYIHFSIEEREQIQYGLWEKKSIRSIAKTLGRHHVSVSREIKRNLPPIHRVYTPRLANQKALHKRKLRGRLQRLKNQTIRDYVIKELKKRTSPEQISGRIREDLGQSISHEAIYQFIYHQVHRHGFGLLKPGQEDLRGFLRRRKKRRTPKGMRRCQRMHSTIRGISIDMRPKVVSDRSRIGDWESDTVESKDHKPGINTFVERKTGLVFITRLANRTSQATIEAIESRSASLPKELKKTATFDNGFENQGWETLEKDIGIKCFFAHPYHSWERGTNENTNGLIRDYFPKKTDFDTITDEQLQEVENLLNNRPRKRHGWKTPYELFSVALEG